MSALSRRLDGRGFRRFLGGALLTASFLAMSCSSSTEEPALKHDCVFGDTACYCSAFTEGPAPAMPLECSPNTIANSKCCATPGWPTSAGQCSCKADTTTCPPATEAESTVSVSSCKLDASPISGGTNGGGSCPEPAYKECSAGANCACTGTCARLNTTDSTRYCTRECTTDADCANTWKNTGLSCNTQTFTCTP